MTVTSKAPAIGIGLLLLAVLAGAAAAFGPIQAILIVAIAASAAILCAFLVVASSRDGH